MFNLPATLGLLSIIGFVIWIVSTFRSDGERKQKLKEQEAINDQNDELLEYLKKEKDFIHRLRNDPDYAARVHKHINDDKP